MSSKNIGKRALVAESRDMRIGGVGGVTPPILSNLQEIWSKVSHAARELSRVFSLNLYFVSKNNWFVGQTPPPPPMENASTHYNLSIFSCDVDNF